MFAGTALSVRLISICRSIFIYYKRALRVFGCMRTLRVQPYMGGPEKGQKRGRAKRVCIIFFVM